MSNNYNNNYINQVNYHNRSKNYQKKKNIFPNKGNIREVEINSMSQTEPTIHNEYNKRFKNKKIENELNQIDQFDYISKTNDETLSITNFKQEFIGTNTDDIIFRDYITSQIKSLVCKLEENDFEKKMSDISNKINEVQISLENKIDNYCKKNEEEMYEIKELFNLQNINDLKLKLKKLKGEKYAQNYVINNVFDFEKYYDNILSYDLKEKFLSNNISFSEIINMIYKDFSENNEKKLENLNDKFWFIINYFSEEKKENKLKLNLSGNVYRIIKHFRGLSDDIIIDFGEIICYIDKKEKIDKAKNKMNIIINLIYEILSRQIELSELSNKIFAYGHFYYGKKSKNIELKDFEENSIYYDFIELN